MTRFAGDLVRRRHKRRSRPQPKLGLSFRERPRLRRVRGGWCAETRKAGLDGLADVLGVDDSRWALSAELAGEVGGFVRVEVACLA